MLCVCVCKHFIFKVFYDLNRLIELSFTYIFHNDISPHFKFLLSNERLDFCELKKKDKKNVQPYLIIFTKGADMFGHDCI